MIDPNRASWSVASVINQVFEGLLGFNQDLSLKAVVAEEIPTTGNGGISADGKTYTFKLRSVVPGATMKVTAKDFVYSIKRMLNPEWPQIRFLLLRHRRRRGLQRRHGLS